MINYKHITNTWQHFTQLFTTLQHFTQLLYRIHETFTTNTKPQHFTEIQIMQHNTVFKTLHNFTTFHRAVHNCTQFCTQFYLHIQNWTQIWKLYTTLQTIHNFTKLYKTFFNIYKTCTTLVQNLYTTLPNFTTHLTTLSKTWQHCTYHVKTK